MALPDNKPPILNILVVGFHHKLGCQVEFSHPPLITGTEGRNECPSGWKYLPTLALPDGSHNFVEDTVFFNLPSLMDPTESVFGVSCYRQISVEKLKIRTADVTRSTVQKSVCILARLPIYGYIEVKLSLIADAFFEQGDFSCTELLVKAYQQLNACLLDDDESRSRPRPLRHFYVGLSLREILLHWRHKTLILFKLFLLQRRVICFGSPVRSMCALILGIASLMPCLLEKGFEEVACVRTSRPLSPMPDFRDAIVDVESSAAFPPSSVDIMTTNRIVDNGTEDKEIKMMTIEESTSSPELGSCTELIEDCNTLMSSAAAVATSVSGESSTTANSVESSLAISAPDLYRLDSEDYSAELGKPPNDRNISLTRDNSIDTLAATLLTLIDINPNEYRAPLTIFASGNLCLPYLSLPYMDLLTDPSVHSYVIGTSNVLFQQKRQLADVLVDIENANFETHDPELRRQISLSTEDLRFTDYLIRHVLAPKEDGEGSEQWIRDQFQGYMLALLRTAVVRDATQKDSDHFNVHFMNAFKKTHCFQEWYDVRPTDEFFAALPAGHPFAGTLSVADMKLKLAQTMQNSESGRKINQAVNTTSRAVGGAISQAKGAFSNWWSSITTAHSALSGATNIDSLTSNDTIPQIQSSDITVSFQNNITHTEEIGRVEEEEKEAIVNIKIEQALVFEKRKKNTENDKYRLEHSKDSVPQSERKLFIANAGAWEEAEDEEDISASKSMKDTSQNAADILQKCGIVEIGHEAELLDKEEVPQNCGGDVIENVLTSNRRNGDVFIV